ncbi:MAG: lysine--tRNA ligase [Cyanobacteria bacterium P01_D01_bin.105]
MAPKKSQNTPAANDSSDSGIEGIRATRLQKVADLKQAGQIPYAYQWDITHPIADLQSKFADLEAGAEEDFAVSIAGRIMARRVFGKLAFFTLQDATGTIQLYLEKKTIQAEMGEADEQAFNHLKQLTDAGDILGAKGTIKRTDKGELSVKVKQYAMLTKSLLPLPDKFHGLTDVAKRYRQRYVDLIVNPEVRETFRKRAQITAAIRRHLDGLGYLEVETPVLQAEPGGAEARPFVTYHNTLDMDLYLRIATELHLKRMVVGGFEKVFELGRVFRNEGISTRHNPEFTTIEMYQAYGDYEDMMALTENMIEEIAVDVTGSKTVTYQGEEISFAQPWQRITMHDAVQEKTGIDFSEFDNLAAAKQAAKDAGIGDIDDCESIGHVLNEAFEQKVEETLIQPTFITDYPVEVSPLAKPHRTKPGLVERFELFIVGRETANGFSELTDPVDQRERLERQAAKKEAGDLEACSVDEDFITALEYGMPPTVGLGIGIDRLVMVMTDAASIRDAIAFPLLKAEKTEQRED